MIGRTPPDLRRALRAYRTAPLLDRFHVRVRHRTCPLPDVAATVPHTGAILDLGCGHGLLSLYLTIGGPGRTVTGIDIDEHKLALARTAAAVGAVPVTFEAAPQHGVRPGPWDAIAIVDVLYLLGEDDAGHLLQSAAAQLAPGGLLIVKELATSPAWKFRLAHAQEVLATRVLHITQGSQLAILPTETIAAVMSAAGLAVEERNLSRGRLHPHHLIVGRRAQDASRLDPEHPV